MLLKYIFGVILCVAAANGAKLPSFISRCAANDSACVIAAANKAIPVLINGYKPFNLPSFNPAQVERIDLSIGENLRLELTHGEVKFESFNFTSSNISADWTKWTTISFLDVIFDSDYEVSGHLLLLPLRGKGKFHAKAEKLELEYVANYAIVEKNGKKHLRLARDDLKMQMARLRLRFENLFDGNRVLGEQVNTFIDENWREIERELHSGFLLIATLIRTSYEPIFEHVPLNEISMI